MRVEGDGGVDVDQLPPGRINSLASYLDTLYAVVTGADAASSGVLACDDASSSSRRPPALSPATAIPTGAADLPGAGL